MMMNIETATQKKRGQYGETVLSRAGRPLRSNAAFSAFFVQALNRMIRHDGD
jgi:hypothetical protein